jgi:hypothetical protein
MKRLMYIAFNYLLLLSFAHLLEAKYHHVSDQRRLDALLDTNDLAVVLLYDKAMGQEPIKRIFKELSRGYSYYESDVAFISINSGRDVGINMARAYGIQKIPALLLFEGGELVIGKDMTPVVETTIRSIGDIRLFINTYFGDRIQDILRENEENYRMGRKKRRWSRSGFHFGISFGYPYYPYYGYPFGYQYGYPILMSW